MLRKFYPLKVRSINLEGQPSAPVKWGKLLNTLIQFTKEGFSPDTMRKTIKIMDKLEASYQTPEERNSIENNETSYILFEEDEYMLIKSKFTEGFKFNIVDKALVEFIDDIENMPEYTFVGNDEIIN